MQIKIHELIMGMDLMMMVLTLTNPKVNDDGQEKKVKTKSSKYREEKTNQRKHKCMFSFTLEKHMTKYFSTIYTINLPEFRTFILKLKP